MGRSTTILAVAARGVAAYFRERFPWKTNGAAVVVTFVCSYLLYGNAQGEHHVSWRAACGVATFFLLFLQLRLVDDIDDARKDALDRGDSMAAGESRRKALIAALGLTVVAITILNWGERALAVALTTSAGAALTPFVIRPWVKGDAEEDAAPRDALKEIVLAVFYEGVHFALMLYVYFAWTAASRAWLPRATVLAVAGTFWTAYEFWKYARYATRPEWRPYGLSWGHARAGLVALLAISLACQVSTVFAARLPKAYLVYAFALAAGFAWWLAGVSPDRPRIGARSRARGLIGMSFIGALDLGILVAVLVSLFSRGERG